ncbi:class I SAM-dependent methyltransferase [candidate division KSB1 bacterium]|nr:class I SAM-dependent methyltransferase [candidate division KSB1 bacterium]
MPPVEPFDKYTMEYDSWFERHFIIYQSELLAVKKVIPFAGKGIEIGIGSGRFAIPLGINCGIEPSLKMSQLAAKRKLSVIKGVGEAIPFADETFDFVLLVTTICFLDDVERTLKEIHRILRRDGCIIIGFVDKKSKIGKQYQKNKHSNVFYRDARFYSTHDILVHLNKTGFSQFVFYQTLFNNLDVINQIEAVKSGYGDGSFVVIKAKKSIA